MRRARQRKGRTLRRRGEREGRVDELTWPPRKANVAPRVERDSSYPCRMSVSVRVRPAVRKDMPEVARYAAQLVRFHYALDPLRFMCHEPLEPGYERWLTGELANPAAVIVVAEQIIGGALPAIIGYA